MDVATFAASVPKEARALGSLNRVGRYFSSCPTIAWVVLAVSLLLTYSAYHILQLNIETSAAQRFHGATSDIELAIVERLGKQHLALLGGAGLIRTSGPPTRKEWKFYVDQLQIEYSLPGMLGLGYAEFVKPTDRKAYLEHLRAQGFPHLDITPAGVRPLYSSITYLEPLNERNIQAIGYDMYSEPTRAAAMNAARDTGFVAISGAVTLVQEIDEDVQAGFLMYVPIYRSGMPTDTVEHRRQAIIGYVYSPFRMNDLMAGILGKGKVNIDFKISDTTEAGKARESKLYDSVRANKLAPNRGWELMRKSVIHVYGREWTIHFSSRSGYLYPAEQWGPALVTAASLIVHIMIFILLSRLDRSKKGAEASTRRERKLREAQETINNELQRANRSLTRFTSIAAHDLTGPLRRLESFVKILREDYRDDLDDDGRDIVARIGRGTQRMLSMVSGLLVYSKCGSVAIHHQKFEARSLLNGFMIDLQEADPQAEISLDCDTAITIFGDATLMEHVVRNIINNSLKYRSQAPLKIRLSAIADQHRVTVSIEDNGIGIEPKYAEQVFEMFCRLHNEDEYEGTGIGLAICQRIVNDHGGEIWIDTTYSGGTRVCFTIPNKPPSSMDYYALAQAATMKCPSPPPAAENDSDQQIFIQAM